MREMVHALGIVIAWIKFSCAEGDFRLAELTSETGLAFAGVRFDAIDASCIILALVVGAIVDVHLATGARVTRTALTTEATLLQHCTGGIVAARISVAGVDHELAMLAVVTRLTDAFVLAFSAPLALRVILTGERVAGVAFRKDLVAHLCLALE